MTINAYFKSSCTVLQSYAIFLFFYFESLNPKASMSVSITQPADAGVLKLNIRAPLLQC